MGRASWHRDVWAVVQCSFNVGCGSLLRSGASTSDSRIGVDSGHQLTSGDTRQRLSPTLDAKWPSSCSLGPPIDSLWAPLTTWTPLAATHSTAGTFESFTLQVCRQLVAINSASATIAINGPSFSGVKGRECATARSLPSRLPVEFVPVRAFPSACQTV